MPWRGRYSGMTGLNFAVVGPYKDKKMFEKM